MPEPTSGPTIELSPEFKGTIIGRDEPTYDTARAIYNGSIDRRPRLIVRPTGAADVMDAVNYARTAGLPLSVRCGGHGIAGTAVCDDGVLIDLSSLKGVHVDVDRGTAIAQGGALWGEYDRETQLFGVATPGGRVTTTGVGGFTLGGGYGWLSPRYGLACDNLVAADVVTANGRLVRASENENPELLWGLRGAGANFGVVTSYELRTHSVPPLLLAGLLVVPNQDAGALVRAYRQYVENDAPEDLVTGLAMILAPPEDFVPPELVGTPVLAIVIAYIGNPEDALDAAAPLRSLVADAGGLDLVQPMPYTALQGMLDGFAPKGWLNYHRGIHLERLSDDTVDDWLAVGKDIGSPMTQGILFRHGGAVGRVGEDDTAAGNRAAPYMAHPIACWDTPDRTAHEMEWVRRCTAAVERDTSGGVYLNFEPGTSRGDVIAGFGERKYQRLVALKDEWDPTNLFRSNHNIAPSGAPAAPAPQRTVGSDETEAKEQPA